MKKLFYVLLGLLFTAMGNADSSKSEVKLNKDDRWFELSRPYLEELKPMEDLDLDAYVRDMVSTAKDFNANTLVMMADDGGYPLYPSKLAPINSHIHDKDLLTMIERQCRANGLRFGLAYIGVHTNSHIAATKPDWAQREKDGRVYPFFHWHPICLNSPYGNYYRELVKEALQRYSVDYLYLALGQRIHYHDEATGKLDKITAMPGSKEYNNYWRQFLKALPNHLKAKGWFEKTTIAMDERELEDMRAIIALLDEVCPEMKITLAGNRAQRQLTELTRKLSNETVNGAREQLR